jgi:hypothetical protein
MPSDTAAEARGKRGRGVRTRACTSTVGGEVHVPLVNADL